MPQKNRAEYNAYMRKCMTERYHRRRLEVVSMLGGRCVDCGSSDGLELDHADVSSKQFELAKALSGWSVTRLALELPKLVLRCRRCHLVKTILERGQVPGGRHGAVSTYQRAKCRCDLCMEAARAAKARYKAKKLGS